MDELRMESKGSRWITVLALAASCFWGVSGATQARETLDMLITGGKVYKQAPGTVVGISDGKISYLGPMIGAEPMVTKQTRIVDAEKSGVYPGFIELHTHYLDTVAFTHIACEINPEAGDAGTQACKKVARRLKPNQWLVGFSAGLFDKPLKQQSPREWLDTHFPDVPTVVIEPHASLVWVNSKGLDEMLVTRHGLDPIGGKILRGGDQQPTGVILGSVAEVVMEKALESHRATLTQLYSQVAKTASCFERHGVTSLGDAGSLWFYGGIDFWQQLARDNRLNVRVSVRPKLSPYKGVNAQLEGLKELYRNDLSDRLLINQVKLHVDGQYHLGTARLSVPYSEPSIDSEPYGLFFFSPTELNTWLMRLNEIGYGAYIHAQGDEAIKAALYSIQNVRRENDDSRFTLSNMRFIHEPLYKLLHDLDVTANFYLLNPEFSRQQPPSHILDKKEAVSISELLKHKVSVALGSAGLYTNKVVPLARISESLQKPEIGIDDIYQAIDSYTIEPAKALGIESITGSLVVGKSADLVIINQDLTAIPAEKIAQAKVMMTVLQGQVTFERGNAGASNQTAGLHKSVKRDKTDEPNKVAALKNNS